MSAAYIDTLATVGPDFGKIGSGSVEMMPIFMVETINSFTAIQVWTGT
jgi:hypothetical protein